MRFSSNNIQFRVCWNPKPSDNLHKKMNNTRPLAVWLSSLKTKSWFIKLKKSFTVFWLCYRVIVLHVCAYDSETWFLTAIIATRGLYARFIHFRECVPLGHLCCNTCQHQMQENCAKNCLVWQWNGAVKEIWCCFTSDRHLSFLLLIFFL